MKTFNKGNYIYIRDNDDNCYIVYNTNHKHNSDELIGIKFLDETKKLDTTLGIKEMPICEVTFNKTEDIEDKEDTITYKMVYRPISRKRFIKELWLLK